MEYINVRVQDSMSFAKMIALIFLLFSYFPLIRIIAHFGSEWAIVTTLCPSYVRPHLWTAALKPWGKFSSNFSWDHLLMGDWNLNSLCPLIKMAAMPVYGKNIQKTFYSITASGLNIGI